MTERTLQAAIAGPLGGWAALAIWFVPAAIRWVHGGGGPAAIGHWMKGRAEVPLEAYLARWSGLALPDEFVPATVAIARWSILPLVRLGREFFAGRPMTTRRRSGRSVCGVVGVGLRRASSGAGRVPLPRLDKCCCSTRWSRASGTCRPTVSGWRR